MTQGSDHSPRAKIKYTGGRLPPVHFTARGASDGTLGIYAGRDRRRGLEIYEREIRSEVEPMHSGEYVVIDVDTHTYELDADHLAASLRAFKRRPDGVRFGMRVGSRSIGRIGFAPNAERR